MGIYYEAKFIFGVQFSLIDVEKWSQHKSIRDFAVEIGYDIIQDDWISGTWQEYNGITTYPYFDPIHLDKNFYRGITLPNYMNLTDLKMIMEKESEIKKDIQQFCAEFNLVCSHEIKFIVAPNVI